jgi:hypothetical protein
VYQQSPAYETPPSLHAKTVVDVVDDVVVELVVEVVVVGASVLVVVDGNVVVVTLVVVVPPSVVVVVVPPRVVVVPSHGQLSETSVPTTNCRQPSASVAVIPPEPVVSQLHSGSQLSRLTPTRRMKRQSVATGALPTVSGCAQSPRSAPAENAVPSTTEKPRIDMETHRENRRISTPHPASRRIGRISAETREGNAGVVRVGACPPSTSGDAA